ncbi:MULTISPECIES: SRPBCC family protein [Rhodomicrobium]|uniref:SRPBCC family protein n=1 Tax=Rhodomicrobium TaxID=1068 RepID=UPI000B4A799B|nr:MULTISPECIES: SRPBCC family protein [Rhodomicrobium]
MKSLLALIAAFLWSGAALAHGPTPQTVTETVEIAATPAQVWAVVKDFDALAKWHPEVEACRGGGNAVGAEREITLKTGTITDSLDEYVPAAMTYSYRLAKENPAAFPVSFYSATLSVKPSAGGASVEWLGRFYRADTGNYPPDTLNDEAAMAAMTAFFKTGLGGLKQKVEGRH